jgi:alkanesulfonate monooxygenase SsuD/methylene tetrahydromethanopterin reductase-like flavin-dependent oxidoreductase (luciferase family)
MDIGALGVFGYLDTMTGSEAADYARTVERLGYSVLWFPETFGRDPFALAVHLLGATSRLIVATGIANVWKREAIAMAGSARTVAELFDDRFILGLGVSGGPFNGAQRTTLREAGDLHARIPFQDASDSTQGADRET